MEGRREEKMRDTRGERAEGRGGGEGERGKRRGKM